MDKNDIIRFCERHAGNEYTITEDGRIIIHRGIYLDGKSATLPDNLTVEGELFIDGCGLTSCRKT